MYRWKCARSSLVNALPRTLVSPLRKQREQISITIAS
jgi:hypothetical protein